VRPALPAGWTPVSFPAYGETGVLLSNNIGDARFNTLPDSEPDSSDDEDYASAGAGALELIGVPVTVLQVCGAADAGAFGAPAASVGGGFGSAWYHYRPETPRSLDRCAKMNLDFQVTSISAMPQFRQPAKSHEEIRLTDMARGNSGRPSGGGGGGAGGGTTVSKPRVTPEMAHAANERVDAEGRTKLCVAARDNKMEQVQALLAAGADPNLGRTDIGTTPVYFAAQKGHPGVLALLLNANADPFSARADDGRTPVYVAAQNGFADVLALLLEANADPSTSKATTGATPVYIAAHNGHANTLELLLEANADPSTARTDGTTPLTIAKRKGHTAAAALLTKQLAVYARLPTI
jgi:hypothetical protein